MFEVEVLSGRVVVVVVVVVEMLCGQMRRDRGSRFEIVRVLDCMKLVLLFAVCVVSDEENWMQERVGASRHIYTCE